MCERCLEQAVINETNGKAIKELADAAAILSNHVGGSKNAIEQIVKRIESIVTLEEPEPKKASAPEPENVEASAPKLPPEVQRIKDLFERLGIEAEFVDGGKL